MVIEKAILRLLLTESFACVATLLCSIRYDETLVDSPAERVGLRQFAVRINAMSVPV